MKSNTIVSNSSQRNKTVNPHFVNYSALQRPIVTEQTTNFFVLTANNVYQ